MSLDIHRRAELLMGQGDHLAVQGRSEEAAASYRAAAAEEVRAFDLVPIDRARTRGVIAVSALALYRKAGALDEGIRQAHAFLAQNGLPTAALLDIEELLDDLRAERAAQIDGRVLAKDSFEWVLRGPRVGLGDARIATVMQKVEQIAKYGIRVFEYLANVRPIRTAGPVAPRVLEAFEMRVTQPFAGSFRFLVRFSMPPRQLPLFEATDTVQPEQMAEAFGSILDAAATPESPALAEAVQDRAYQDAFLRLVRALSPDGKDLRQVQVNGLGRVATSTVLTRESGRLITTELGKRRPKRELGTEHSDTLRGLNLNEGWILLGQKGQERKCYIAPGVVLTDIVEGLIDRPVRVSGHWERNRFIVDDLEGVSEAAEEPLGAEAESA